MFRLKAYFLKGLPVPSFHSYQELASQCLFIAEILAIGMKNRVAYRVLYACVLDKVPLKIKTS